MMRILITGTTGQVGHALQEVLRGRGQILAPTRSDFDLSNPNSLVERLDALEPTLIINSAAYTAVDRAEDEVELAFRVNAEAPTVIAHWASRHRVPFVQFSTNYVFSGVRDDRPWREDDPCEPLSVYGKSKLKGELSVREAGGAHLIARTSWVYAAVGNNFVRTIFKLAQEKIELRVVSDQLGTPTSAKSLAWALKSVLPDDVGEMSAAFSKVGGILHIANAGSTSRHGFASSIVKGLRERGIELKVIDIVPTRTKDFSAKAVRPLDSRLDLTRLAGTFGINMPSWQQALSEELDEFAAKAS
jgi:dTDP-4-dehydrorhamnose reductase